MTITFDPKNKIELIAAYEMITTLYNGTFKTETENFITTSQDELNDLLKQIKISDVE